MTGHCLVVDDDAEIRTSLTAFLQGFGWRVSAAADGRAMRQMLAAARPDAIVLDLMLPGEDGLALLRWLGTQADAPPVLMLTARGDTMSRVVGLELGADDYLAKPFEPRELVARLQALVRRAHRGGPAAAEDTRLDLGFARELRRRQRSEAVLEQKEAEFRLLAAFVQRPGRVLSREQLIELTRAPGVEVNDRSIDLAVSRLRAKRGDTAREPALIRTVRGEGYLFDAEVAPC